MVDRREIRRVEPYLVLRAHAHWIAVARLAKALQQQQAAFIGFIGGHFVDRHHFQRQFGELLEPPCNVFSGSDGHRLR